VSVLVNNVGMAKINNFHNLNEQSILDTINVNCHSQAVLTRIFIPRFLQRLNSENGSKNKKSAIIDLSSITSVRPYPY